MTPGKLAALALCVFTLLFARSMTRPLDLDEHQFVAPPALLVHQGVVPYSDYPYFHMPTLVYVYAGLTGWIPYKLLAARLVSVACGTATVMLLFLAGWRALPGVGGRGRWLLAGGLALTFMTSRLFTYTNGWAWNHDTAGLCMLAAVLLHLRGLERGRVVPLAAAGFLLGCAIGIRLSFALAFLPLGGSVCLSRSPLSARGRLAGLGLAAAATALALAPAFAGLFAAPEQFLFGNLVYPRLNTRFYLPVATGAMTLPGKFYHAGQTFLTDPGNAGLALLAGLALFRCLVSPAVRTSALRPRLVVVGATLPFLCAGAMGPSPGQYQYYFLLLPFLVLFVLWAAAAEAHLPGVWQTWRRVAGAVVLVTALTGLPRWYWGVVALPFPDAWIPVQVHRLGEWVAAHTAPGGRVLTLEPLIAQEGGAAVYPEYAVGRFIMHVGPLMTAEDRRRQHMAWGRELDRLLRQMPPASVLTHCRTQSLCPDFEAYARRRGFLPVRAPGGEFVLWAPPAGPRAALVRP
jgi:hypothetical protein